MIFVYGVPAFLWLMWLSTRRNSLVGRRLMYDVICILYGVFPLLAILVLIHTVDFDYDAKFVMSIVPILALNGICGVIGFIRDGRAAFPKTASL